MPLKGSIPFTLLLRYLTLLLQSLYICCSLFLECSPLRHPLWLVLSSPFWSLLLHHFLSEVFLDHPNHAI